MKEDELKANLSSYKIQLEQINQLIAGKESNNETYLKLKLDIESIIDMTNDLLQSSDANVQTKSKWKVGKVCEAFMSKDNCYKVGKIKEILDDGSCCVAFGKYSEIVQIDSLKHTNKLDPETEKRKAKKRKFEEKKEMEEQFMEKSKNAWLTHQKKAMKGPAGHKKSIFSTTDNGKVGVGTNMIADRPRVPAPQVQKMKKGVPN